jgi:DNA-binding MarR family transcriptional regulator
MVDTDTQIRDLPPSAKLVFKVLEYNPDLTQKQIGNKTRLSQRTVRDGLDRLIDGDIIEKNLYAQDARQNLYSIASSTHAEPTESSNAMGMTGHVRFSPTLAIATLQCCIGAL